MLQKKYRLTSDFQIKRIFSKSRKLDSKNFKVYVHVRSHGEKKGPRFVFIVSAKYVKKAVDRNRIKRRMREVVKEIINEKEDKLVGKDIAFYIVTNLEKKEQTEISPTELKKEVVTVLDKAAEI